MTTPRILYIDLAKTATLTKNSEDAAFPVSNIQHEFRTKEYRTTGLTSEWVVIDLGSAQSVTMLAIMNHNFQSGGTYKLQGNATDSWGTPSVDITLTYNATNLFHYMTAQTYRYWRILMTNTTGTYISLGRVMLGSYFQPAKSFDIGSYSNRIVDLATSSQSIGGQIHSDVKNYYHEIALTFSHITATDRDNWVTMFETILTHQAIVLTVDTTSTSTINATTYYGRLPDIKEILHSLKTVNGERYSFVLNFEELL